LRKPVVLKLEILHNQPKRRAFAGAARQRQYSAVTDPSRILRDPTSAHLDTAAPALTLSELRARIFDEMSDAVLVADDERRYVDANAAACALLGLSREQIVSLKVEDVMPANGNIEELWRAFLATGSQRGEMVFSRGDERAVIEYRARARIAPNRHVSVLRDVTSRVDAAHAAERVRAILDELLMAAPIGFALLGRDLRFQLVNPVLAQINGLSVEAHLGKTPTELLPGIPADFIRDVARAVFDTGKAQVDLELVGETPAAPGLKRTFVEHWFPVRLHEEIIGVGVVVLEVTEQRHAEARARDANERRQRLMAIVSHDLRNPLSAIVTAAALIGMSGEAPREVLTLGSRVATASLRMQRLVEQLLDFVRVDQGGGIGLTPSAMDLAAAARHVTDEVGLASPNASFHLSTNGNTVGDWDEDRILQVLSNLLSNAVQHGDGHVEVTIDGSSAEEVRLEISNLGTPIAPQLLKIIFDPFQRAGGGYARRAGLGLGLFITKSIVESHRGSVSARSDETGTTFSVVLPRH
jgi:PAS domain S-box-containing protein